MGFTAEVALKDRYEERWAKIMILTLRYKARLWKKWLEGEIGMWKFMALTAEMYRVLLVLLCEGWHLSHNVRGAHCYFGTYRKRQSQTILLMIYKSAMINKISFDMFFFMKTWHCKKGKRPVLTRLLLQSCQGGY